jgi:hypothetical protein
MDSDDDNDNDNGEPFFLYMGQSRDDIPQNVTRVKVDPSVREIRSLAFCNCSQLRNVELNEGVERIEYGAFFDCTSLTSIRIPSTVKQIGKMAFHGCNQLTNVELNEGLERIDKWAFHRCKSLTSIIIPSTVKVIGKDAFSGCSQLRNVKLNEGLECIEGWAFQGCTSLTSIIIPSTVKEISGEAFKDCSQLRIVELNEGLERIEWKAFKGCMSLESIRIPSSVKKIAKDAFEDCNNLEAIEFCNEIEKFVNEVSLQWWNHGVSKASLRMYSFLVEGNIPARLSAIKCRAWKDNIYNMLQRIEELKEDKYFDSIESQLANYVYLQEVAPFLELALWKAKITEQQSNGDLIRDDTKMLCRIDSFAMFAVVFPNVLSFLFEE